MRKLAAAIALMLTVSDPAQAQDSGNIQVDVVVGSEFAPGFDPGCDSEYENDCSDPDYPEDALWLEPCFIGWFCALDGEYAAYAYCQEILVV